MGKYKAEYATFRLVEALILLLPPRFADSLGLLIGKLGYRFAHRRRQIVERNFRIGWELSGEELQQTTRQCMETCGANLFGGTRCAKMTDAEIASCVEIEGAEILREELHKGQGAIVALAHMGNWEILARLGPLVIPGKKFGAYFRPLNNPFMNELIMRRRSRSGMTLFSKSSSFAQANAFLRDGGTLGILSDQHAGKTGDNCPFFGRHTSCAPLPALLHRRSGAPIFFASLSRIAPAKWKLILHKHLGIANTNTIMLGVEKALRVSPADGFWLHDRWKTSTRSPLSLTTRKTSSVVAQLKKSSPCYIQLSDNATIRKASLPALHYLIQERPDFCYYTNHAGHLPASVMIENTPSKWLENHTIPLDIILWCDTPPQTDASFPSIIFAGIGSRTIFTHGITTQSDPSDPKTWWHLLSTLGMTLPPAS